MIPINSYVYRQLPGPFVDHKWRRVRPRRLMAYWHRRPPSTADHAVSKTRVARYRIKIPLPRTASGGAWPVAGSGVGRARRSSPTWSSEDGHAHRCRVPEIGAKDAGSTTATSTFRCSGSHADFFGWFVAGSERRESFRQRTAIPRYSGQGAYQDGQSNCRILRRRWSRHTLTPSDGWLDQGYTSHLNGSAESCTPVHERRGHAGATSMILTSRTDRLHDPAGCPPAPWSKGTATRARD